MYKLPFLGFFFWYPQRIIDYQKPLPHSQEKVKSFHLHLPFAGPDIRRQWTVRSTIASCLDHPGGARVNSTSLLTCGMPPILQQTLLQHLPSLVHKVWLFMSAHEIY